MTTTPTKTQQVNNSNNKSTTTTTRNLSMTTTTINNQQTNMINKQTNQINNNNQQTNNNQSTQQHEQQQQQQNISHVAPILTSSPSPFLPYFSSRPTNVVHFRSLFQPTSSVPSPWSHEAFAVSLPPDHVVCPAASVLEGVSLPTLVACILAHRVPIILRRRKMNIKNDRCAIYQAQMRIRFIKFSAQNFSSTAQKCFDFAKNSAYLFSFLHLPIMALLFLFLMKTFQSFLVLLQSSGVRLFFSLISEFLLRFFLWNKLEYTFR